MATLGYRLTKTETVLHSCKTATNTVMSNLASVDQIKSVTDK